jgi:hypothetical protein
MCKCGVIHNSPDQCCNTGPKGPIPHKHAEVIKAWADGAVIEGKHPDDDKWILCLPSSSPQWYLHWEYRVKPIPKPLWEVARTAYFDACSRGIAETNALWSHVAQAVVEAHKEQQ